MPCACVARDTCATHDGLPGWYQAAKQPAACLEGLPAGWLIVEMGERWDHCLLLCSMPSVWPGEPTAAGGAAGRKWPRDFEGNMVACVAANASKECMWGRQMHAQQGVHEQLIKGSTADSANIVALIVQTFHSRACRHTGLSQLELISNFTCCV